MQKPLAVTRERTLPARTAPVFVLREGVEVSDHPFLRSLLAADRAHLIAFTRAVPVKSGHLHPVFLPSGVVALLLGVGYAKQFSNRRAILAARRGVALARGERVRAFAVHLDDLRPTGSREAPAVLAERAAVQFELANFEFIRYKTAPPEGWNFVERVTLVSSGGAAVDRAVSRGQTIGREINAARELSNTPGGDMTPQHLAEAAARAGKEAGFSVKVLDEKEIAKLGMGGVLGVSKGSDAPPRFIVMEYLRGSKKEAPVVLVGKGVTFDTGGLNLKPEQGIYEMHMDMSGGAAVIHTLAALARLKVRQNVIGLVPAVENMPSGSSYRPGDQLKTMSGKTIEVLNTDAEGRIILADALTYAKRYSPRLIIDVATLTGAAMVALGQRATALFTTDRRLEKTLRDIGEQTGDFVWPLPLWEEYEEDIKGTFGDVANSSKGRYGGAITAAVFLWQFVKDDTDKKKGSPSAASGSSLSARAPAWIHLDIAPRMTSIEGDALAKGAAGAAINLLVDFLSGDMLR